MFFLGCRSCCPEDQQPSPLDCELSHQGQRVVREWTFGAMTLFTRMCLNSGPIQFDFLYAPTMTRLSPPDGNPGLLAGGSCFGSTAEDYFVVNRPTSRHVNPRGHICTPVFGIVPGPTGGLEAPASVWLCGPDYVYGMSSSTGSLNAPGGHDRNGLRWPAYQWDRNENTPAMTLWEFIAACVKFEPSRITITMNISWHFEVDIYTGGINNYAALWGLNESKQNVTTRWEVGLKTKVFDRDEPAARAMLAGDLGGRLLWSHSSSQTIPGDATRGGRAGDPQFQKIVEDGSVSLFEMDVSSELQNTDLQSQVFWLGPKISPPFGDKLVHMATALIYPLTNPVPYPVGYTRTGYFLATLAAGPLPIAGAFIDAFKVYP